MEKEDHHHLYSIVKNLLNKILFEPYHEKYYTSICAALKLAIKQSSVLGRCNAPFWFNSVRGTPFPTNPSYLLKTFIWLPSALIYIVRRRACYRVPTARSVQVRTYSDLSTPWGSRRSGPRLFYLAQLGEARNRTTKRSSCR